MKRTILEVKSSLGHSTFPKAMQELLGPAVVDITCQARCFWTIDLDGDRNTHFRFAEHLVQVIAYAERLMIQSIIAVDNLQPGKAPNTYHLEINVLSNEEVH